MATTRKKPPARTRPPRIALLIESRIEYGRNVLLGVARYIRSHQFWHADLVDHAGRGLWEAVMSDGGGYDGAIIRHGPFGQQKPALPPIPVVNVSSSTSADQCPRVCSNAEAIGRMAADYFADLGFRHFAYVGPARLDSTGRMHGFRQQLADRGLGQDLQCLQIPSAGHGQIAGQILDWSRGLPRPVAVLAFSDYTGRVTIESCRDAGLRVPDDVAVLGIDNDEMMCEFSPVPLSSIEVPAEDIGYEAARMLDDLMAGRVPPSSDVQMPPRYIVSRASTDALAIEDPEVVAAVQYIRQNVSAKLNVESVLEHTGISRRSLELRFRKALNRSPAEEIRRALFDRATTMLADPQTRVGQVAGRLGFRSLRVFTTIFRKVVGVSPTEYRRRLAGGVPGNA